MANPDPKKEGPTPTSSPRSANPDPEKEEGPNNPREGRGQSPSQEWEGHICQYFFVIVFYGAFPSSSLGLGPASPFLYSLVKPGPPLQDRAWSLLLSFWLGAWPSHSPFFGWAWLSPLLGRGLANPDPKGQP